MELEKQRQNSTAMDMGLVVTLNPTKAVPLCSPPSSSSCAALLLLVQVSQFLFSGFTLRAGLTANRSPRPSQYFRPMWRSGLVGQGRVWPRLILSWRMEPSHMLKKLLWEERNCGPREVLRCERERGGWRENMATP